MAEISVVYWRDIPAQIVARAGRRKVSRQLPERFAIAIDACAMATGARSSDAYLAEWRRGSPSPCGDDLESEADRLLAEIEMTYDREHLKQLVARGGEAVSKCSDELSSDN